VWCEVELGEFGDARGADQATERRGDVAHARQLAPGLLHIGGLAGEGRVREPQGRGQLVQSLTHSLPATIRVRLEAIEIILVRATGFLGLEFGSLV
jgi:hypothetical protein